MPVKQRRGIEGLGVKTHIDKGTLMRNASPKPGTIGTGRTLEGISQSVYLGRGLANSDIDNQIVAIVYFKTDEHKVHYDDRVGLYSLVKSLNDRLKEGFKISLKCIGSADWRHNIGYNNRLGRRRADSVKTEIKNMVQNKGLKVTIGSVGEKYALQPKGDKLPSLKSIVNDRHVKVIIDKKGYIAPIIFSAVGDTEFSASIEEYILNKERGKVVSTNKISNDPLLPTVIIKTILSTKNVSGRDEVFIKCEVIYAKTKKVLFTVSADTVGKVIKEKTYINPKPSNTKRINGQKSPKIERVVIPKHTDPKDAKGKVTKERIETIPRQRAKYLVDEVCKKLKGSYNSITKRVEAAI